MKSYGGQKGFSPHEGCPSSSPSSSALADNVCVICTQAMGDAAASASTDCITAHAARRSSSTAAAVSSSSQSERQQRPLREHKFDQQQQDGVMKEKDLLHTLSGCHHTFHTDCLQRWAIASSINDRTNFAVKSPTCPNCRHSFLRKEVGALVPVPVHLTNLSVQLRPLLDTALSLLFQSYSTLPSTIVTPPVIQPSSREAGSRPLQRGGADPKTAFRATTAPPANLAPAASTSTAVVSNRDVVDHPAARERCPERVQVIIEGVSACLSTLNTITSYAITAAASAHCDNEDQLRRSHGHDHPHSANESSDANSDINDNHTSTNVRHVDEGFNSTTADSHTSDGHYDGVGELLFDQLVTTDWLDSTAGNTIRATRVAAVTLPSMMRRWQERRDTKHRLRLRRQEELREVDRALQEALRELDQRHDQEKQQEQTKVQEQLELSIRSELNETRSLRRLNDVLARDLEEYELRGEVRVRQMRLQLLQYQQRAAQGHEPPLEEQEELQHQLELVKVHEEGRRDRLKQRLHTMQCLQHVRQQQAEQMRKTDDVLEDVRDLLGRLETQQQLHQRQEKLAVVYRNNYS